MGIEIVFLETRGEYSTSKIITGELLRERLAKEATDEIRIQ